jgi:hypothetical protein
MILSQTSPQGVPEDHVQLISCPSLIVKNNHREDNFKRKTRGSGEPDMGALCLPNQHL